MEVLNGWFVVVRRSAMERVGLMWPAPAYVNLGSTLSAQKKLPGAIAAFHKALELNPDHPDAHGAMGLTLLRQGSFREASQATKKALTNPPSPSTIRTRIG